MKLLDKEMSKGLKGDAGTAADVKMYPTFVGPLPQQSDKEEFLVLELNLPRVELALVRLQDHNASVIESENYTPPTGVQLDTLERLSGFIAMCIFKFTKKRKLAGKEWPLALIFPFPCQHEGPDRACLVKLTKEVTCKDVQGQDIHELIRGAINKSKKNSSKIQIVAIVNDNVSTLASVADSNPDCLIGLIVDGGLNACYLENRTRISTKGPQDGKAVQMIINTELGALGENGCLNFCRTDNDKELDEYSSRPGSQILEKMVSGMYLGEIVRLVLEGLTRKNLMFRSVSRACNLFHRGCFNTECVMGIESDNEEPHQNTKKILDHLAVKDYTDEDVKNVRRVCSIICERAACLTAASLATLINHVNLSPVTVVVDGYLYQRHPRFQVMMLNKTRELVNPELEFHLVRPQLERSIGAARIAAAALRSGNSSTDTPGATQNRGSSHTEPGQPSPIGL
ncbi:hexokinase type 2-like isoform X1 [Littorina saxatilis]|uniref:hexokinase type 2-like isoform X1 n=1 Tax=Littorina saxatilis TaxID=31220 RepID=UPI0038B59F34